MRLPRSLALALALLLLAIAASPASALDNRVARTPPMGWNQWNQSGCLIDEKLVLETANALVSSGMRDAGYRYVNVDDCWMAHRRGEDGSLVANSVRFPHGMRWLAAQLHRRGLKFGLYISAGLHTCARYPGSYGHLGADIKRLAGWGIDYLKVDWCWPPERSNPAFVYNRISDVIAKTHRPIVFSVSDGFDPAWTWGPGTANLWRTDVDLDDTWASITAAVDRVAPLARFAGPGAWNDPDMLQVGNGGLTPSEERAHMSLWSIVAAPLIAGNDVRSMSAATRALLVNREVIAIDQDPGGRPGERVRAQHGHEVWVRQLSDGGRAVLLFNRTGRTARMRVNLGSLPGVGAGRSYRVRDVWAHRSTRVGSSIVARVQPHGVAVFRVRARRSDPGTTSAKAIRREDPSWHGVLHTTRLVER